MVRLLKNEIFARKSKTRREPDLDQLQLFVKSDAPPAPEPVEELVIETHTRKKRGGSLVNVDESPFQILKEPGRSNTTKSYMWVFCGGDPECKSVVYQYHPIRSGQVPVDFLGEYKGYAQSDAFAGMSEFPVKMGSCTSQDYEARPPRHLDAKTIAVVSR